jgi:hypothetical protein
MDDREEKIRHLAYALWQQDGEPDGGADYYWFRAEEAVLKEERAPAGEPEPEFVVRPEPRGDEGTAAAAPRRDVTGKVTAVADDKSR